MKRIPEPELMDDEAQALAYAHADFTEPHDMFVQVFAEHFSGDAVTGHVLDLGCGPADVTIRFAKAHPECHIDGLDGAEAMLSLGRDAVARAGLAEHIRLLSGRLPGAQLPEPHYDTIISNSLLHHLHTPAVMWDAVNAWAAPGARVFIMDLRRPADETSAAALVTEYAGQEPAVLRRDFYNSLLAAFEPDEVRAQLADAGLGALRCEVISDRHLVVSGRLPGP